MPDEFNVGCYKYGSNFTKRVDGWFTEFETNFSEIDSNIKKETITLLTLF